MKPLAEQDVKASGAHKAFGSKTGSAGWTATRSPEEKSLNSEHLLSLMYEKLRHLAASKMQRESGFQTLQPTALVHEAWLRIGPGKPNWDSQAHFFGAAAEAMKRVLVDRARARQAIKRTNTEHVPNGDNAHDGHILRIHEGLTRLELEDKKAAELVTLKFFCGFTTEEIAALKSSNVRAVERQWAFAKARLFQIISADIAGK